jgi:hypothetical protein
VEREDRDFSENVWSQEFKFILPSLAGNALLSTAGGTPPPESREGPQRCKVAWAWAVGGKKAWVTGEVDTLVIEPFLLP